MTELVSTRPQDAAAGGPADDAVEVPPTDPLWYKDAIIYELHVKAFFDANNDGIGDFEGLITKLDYIADLGVTAIWLLPFYPSPLRDDGYDTPTTARSTPTTGRCASSGSSCARRIGEGCGSSPSSW
jgi:maltose alpha-D-glucosyltransferase/alpha-amylase